MFHHKNVLLFCLNQVYQKLINGAIVLLINYIHYDGTEDGLDVNPGAKLATVKFLKIVLFN